MPMPMTASLFCANSRSARRQPLWIVPMSPPSGAREMSSGVSEEVMFATAISRRSCCASCEPDSRIGDGQGEVGDEVAGNGQDRAGQRVGEQGVVVDVVQALQEQQAETGIVEHRLGDQVARQKERDREANQ